jgi:hypothetical protein
MILNRWIIVPVVLAIAIGAWNLYVTQHDTGIILGQVVDAGGAPVEGATVQLWVLNFTTYNDRARAVTNAAGVFRFEGNDSHVIQLGADKQGVGSAPRRPVRLWFRAQELHLSEPLRLQ